MGRMKVPDHRPRLVGPHAETQVEEILDAVGPPAPLRGGKQSKHPGLGGLVPGRADREPAGITPRLQWSGQPEEQNGHEDA